MKKQTATSVGEVVFITALAGLLITIVSPIVAGRRLTGDAATCSSNERRIGIALRLYADDYDGAFPINRNPPGNWKDAVWPYLASDVAHAKTVFTCPSNFEAWVSDAAGGPGDETGRWPRSYGYNSAPEYSKSLTTSMGNTVPVRITDFKTPGRYILVLETRYNAPDLGPWFIDGNAAPDGKWSNPSLKYLNFTPNSGKGQFHHHDKYMNVVMLDGHATSVTLPQTIAVPQMWNPYQAPDAYTGKLAGMVDEYK